MDSKRNLGKEHLVEALYVSLRSGSPDDVKRAAANLDDAGGDPSAALADLVLLEQTEIELRRAGAYALCLLDYESAREVGHVLARSSESDAAALGEQVRESLEQQGVRWKLSAVDSATDTEAASIAQPARPGVFGRIRRILSGVFGRIRRILSRRPTKRREARQIRSALLFSGIFLGGNRKNLERDLIAAINSPSLADGRVDSIDVKVLEDLGVVITVGYLGPAEYVQEATSILRRSLERHQFKLD